MDWLNPANLLNLGGVFDQRPPSVQATPHPNPMAPMARRLLPVNLKPNLVEKGFTF